MLTASAARIRLLEKAAIDSGTPEYELMLRAGIQAAGWAKHLFPEARRFVILAGGGNNGGDVLVMAANLQPYDVIVYSLREKHDFKGCAANAAKDLPENIPFHVCRGLDKNFFRPGDVVVDGLLGIGFAGGQLRQETANFISAVNAAHCPVIALDLPSGIEPDSGSASPDGAVKAFCTLTFGKPKRGLFVGEGAVCRGALRVLDIGLDGGCDGECDGGCEVFCNLDAVGCIPRPDLNCHKNSRGRVTVWGSSPEYPGAAALSTLAALKAGAGIVRCASEADLSGHLCRAAIFRKLQKCEIPTAFLKNSDALVCGCGWGNEIAAECLSGALAFPGTLVLDADGLNLLSRHPELWQPGENVILTPHPGEAARLLNAFGIADSGRAADNALALADKLKAVILLKGRNTLVASPSGRLSVNASGSPLLATAGSGDVLSGIIGALAAQGVPAFQAAQLGAYIHGIAGELPHRMIIADELPELAGEVIFKLQFNLPV